MLQQFFARAFAVLFAFLASTPVLADETIRLYTLDCGRLALEPAAMDWFDDTGAYAHTRGEMSLPCFLIRHPDGDLLWNAGIGDVHAGKGEVALGDGVSGTVARSLAGQLEEIGVPPRDVEFVAFSHHHFDHTGNASLFSNATYLVNAREMEWTRTAPFGVDAERLAHVNDANARFIHFDHDVFGDRRVRILRAPGHTPGHQVLLVHLGNAGTILLSGDLYHTRENFERRRVPIINHSRAETLATFDRIHTLMRAHRARLVIEHAPEDIAALPAFPGYLD